MSEVSHPVSEHFFLTFGGRFLKGFFSISMPIMHIFADAVRLADDRSPSSHLILA